MVKSKQLLSPAQLKNLYPLHADQKAFVEKARQDIGQILDGQDLAIC